MSDSLSTLFESVAYKKLSMVDLPQQGSHQHELNASGALQAFFQHQAAEGDIEWRYFSDSRDPLRDEGRFKCYDPRAKSYARTGRSEWRVYYTGEFLRNTAPGDTLILARGHDGRIFGLVFEEDSGWLRTALDFFSGMAPTEQGQLIPRPDLDASRLDAVRQYFLDELDLPVEAGVAASDTELVVKRFGDTFPQTKVMSAFAREQTDSDLLDDDATLLAWLDREEELFRALEHREVAGRLEAGFAAVEDFLTYSLSVQNRRKSRMGHALQNQLAALFDLRDIRYTAQAVTEGKASADFLFPGKAQYHNAAYPDSLLVFLGAKSTCKDRWRQILSEADRIPQKHLCTLEPGISPDQTDEMRSRQVRLVLPARLHGTYTAGQRDQILSVRAFTTMVKAIPGP